MVVHWEASGYGNSAPVVNQQTAPVVLEADVHGSWRVELGQPDPCLD